MTLPVGVSVCTVSVGKAISFVGTEAAVSVTVSGSMAVIHSATGWAIYPASDSVSGTLGGDATIQLPHVDQAGFVNTLGAPVTMWYYNVAVDVVFPSGERQSFATTLQPVVGQDSLDLDLVPRTSPAGVVTGDIPAVTSVAGLTGAVSSSAILAALGPALPAMILDTDSTMAANSDTVAASQKATKTALALKANLAGATFTGAVIVPAPTVGGHAATKTYVDNADALKADLASPTFTGTVTVPTPTVGGAAATKAYVDGILDANNAFRYIGGIDCSGNPNYPAADAGHVYKVTVAGKIGGAAGSVVQQGDSLTCLVDGTAAGTEAAVGANWLITQTNIDGAVVGPAASTAGNIATYSGATGKVIQDSGKSHSTDGTFAANSDNLIPTQKAVKTYTDTALGFKAPLAGPTFTGSVTVPTPTLATDAANKGYVDGISSANSTVYVSTASAARNATTAFNDDTDLSIALAANSGYLVKYWLEFNIAAGGGTALDLKMNQTVPAGASGQWGPTLNYIGQAGATGTARSALTAYGSGNVQTFALDDGVHGVAVTSKVFTGATAGNLVTAWAPNASVAFDLQRIAGAVVEVKKLY